MGWFKRWYGANPLHLLAMIGCFALAWYAGAGLLHAKPVGVVVWFAGAVIGHDLILMPLYALADKSVMTVFRHRPPKLPTVPWINYLRVPVVLSGLLLLIWFPLIFRIPSHFPRTTDLSLDPYLGHWLAVTGALFLLSAVALALRLGSGTGRGGRTAPRHGGETPTSRSACLLAIPSSHVTPKGPLTQNSRVTPSSSPVTPSGPATPSSSRVTPKSRVTQSSSPAIPKGRVIPSGPATPSSSRVTQNSRGTPSSRPVIPQGRGTRVTSRTQNCPLGTQHCPLGIATNERT